MREKVSIISLGCARNLVDTEVMGGLLQQAHYEVVSEPTEADIVLINTCSFIDAAKEESIDTILEAARLKEEGRPCRGGSLSRPSSFVRQVPGTRWGALVAQEIDEDHHAHDRRFGSVIVLGRRRGLVVRIVHEEM